MYSILTDFHQPYPVVYPSSAIRRSRDFLIEPFYQRKRNQQDTRGQGRILA